MAATVQRLLAGKPGTLSVTMVDTNGDPAEAAGALTVGVQSVSGQTIVAPGTATTAGSATGVYTVAVTAAQANRLDQWVATWSDAGNGSSQTSDHEVCGGFFFSLTDARNSDAVLKDTAKYPDSMIMAKRQAVEEECEFICDVPFVPRYRRVLLDGTAEPEIFLPDSKIRTVRSAMIITADTTGGAYVYLPSVTSITSTSVAFTVTFATNHSLGPGANLILSGFNPYAYNGNWVVASVPAANQVVVSTNLNPGNAGTIGTAVGATGQVIVFTAGQLASIVIDDDFKIQRNDGGVWDEGRRNVVIEYECGWDAPPGELADASMIRLRSVLNRQFSSVPDRATSFVTEGGTTFRLDLPHAFATGIPEVDAVYNRYSTREYDDADPIPASMQVNTDPSWFSVYHGGRR
jgi:hypothetical protein